MVGNQRRGLTAGRVARLTHQPFDPVEPDLDAPIEGEFFADPFGTELGILVMELADRGNQMRGVPVTVTQAPFLQCEKPALLTCQEP